MVVQFRAENTRTQLSSLRIHARGARPLDQWVQPFTLNTCHRYKFRADGHNYEVDKIVTLTERFRRTSGEVCESTRTMFTA